MTKNLKSNRLAQHISVIIYLGLVCVLLSFSAPMKAQSGIQLEDIQEVRSLAFQPNGEILAIGGRVNDQPGFWLYDVTSGNINGIETEGNVSVISWSPDGNRIAGNGGFGNSEVFQIFDVASQQMLVEFEQTVSPSTILWDSDGSRVATADTGTIYIRNASSGATTLELSLLSTELVGSLSNFAWDNSSNQRMYGLLGFDKKIYVWSSITGTLLQQYTIPFDTEGFALSPDFSKLAVGSLDGDGDILILSASNGASLLTIDGPSDESPQVLVWNPDGIRLASYGGGHNGGVIRVWNATTGQQTDTIPVESFVRPNALVWIPDGSQLVFSAGDSTVQFPELIVTNGPLAFFSNRDGDWEIYSMNPDGTGLLKLTHNTVSEGHPDWSPDGSLVFTQIRARRALPDG